MNLIQFCTMFFVIIFVENLGNAQFLATNQNVLVILIQKLDAAQGKSNC